MKMKNYDIAIDSAILLGNIPLMKKSILMISMGGSMRGSFPSSFPCLTVTYLGISNEKHVVRTQKASINQRNDACLLSIQYGTLIIMSLSL